MADEKKLPQVVKTPQSWKESKCRKFVKGEFQKEVTPKLLRELKKRGTEEGMVAFPSSMEGKNETRGTGLAFRYWAEGREMRRAIDRGEAVDCRNYAAEAVERMKAAEEKEG